MASQLSDADSLTDSLRASGAEVLTDEASLEFFAHDIYDRGANIAAVVRPSDKLQLAAAVKAATDTDDNVSERLGTEINNPAHFYPGRIDVETRHAVIVYIALMTAGILIATAAEGPTAVFRRRSFTGE